MGSCNYRLSHLLRKFMLFGLLLAALLLASDTNVCITDSEMSHRDEAYLRALAQGDDASALLGAQFLLCTDLGRQLLSPQAAVAGVLAADTGSVHTQHLSGRWSCSVIQIPQSSTMPSWLTSTTIARCFATDLT